MPLFPRSVTQTIARPVTIAKICEDQLRIEANRGEARDKCQHNAARYQRRRRRQAQDIGEQF